MRFSPGFCATALAALACLPLPARAQVEPGYDPSKPRAVTLWYAPAGPAQEKADLDFVAGMKIHHEGALSMSAEYLADARAENAALKQLARGIIHNQKFEIGMLDTIRGHYAAGGDAPQVAGLRPVATKGLSQHTRFFRAPVPGPLDARAGSSGVSVRDVTFAKGMIIHHEAALDMARDYLSRPEAANGYLRLMCLDILLDQAQEIAFMRRVIAAYPGDADAVVVDPSSIHGMEGMNHMHKGGGAASRKGAHKDAHQDSHGKHAGHGGH